jgi:pilus assembly protein Flp/PilA
MNIVLRPRLLKKKSLQRETVKMKRVLRRLWRDEQGQDLVEYALLVVLVSLSAIVAMNSLASGISDAFSNAAANLT